MIVHDVRQGSREWWALRLARPTTSRFGRILTAKRLEYSAGAKAFVAELLAEEVLGRPLDDKELDTIWTGRGSELEDEARRWFAFYRDVTVTEVGFITTDDGLAGCSPDGLVGPDEGLEIKCRGAKKHMETVLGLCPIADPLQIQGSLWVTGFKAWNVVAYNPELPKKIERQYPMPAFQDAITKAMERFQADMETGREALKRIGDVVEDDNEAIHETIAAIWAKSAKEAK